MRPPHLPSSTDMMSRTALLLVATVLAGCTHEQPITTAPSDFEQPFAGGEPLRLTYSFGNDRTPQWGADAGHFMYAFDAGRRLDSIMTGCVGAMPSAGGSVSDLICDADPTLLTGVEMRPYWAARQADGATAFVRQYWRGVGLNPILSDLALRPGGANQTTRSVLGIPYFSAPTGRTHSGISHLQWLDPRHLIYVGRAQVNSSLLRIDTGLEIMVVDADSGIGSLAVVPATLFASSVARGATPDTIYYTIGGDSMVYRRTMSTGAIDTVFDFGALGIARDVQVKGGKVVAVVGGAVSFHPYSTYGMVQDDFGGPIYAATLPNGTPVRLADTVYAYRHLALAPDGASVVAERNGDLWRITLP